jgi:hypothetical protein
VTSQRVDVIRLDLADFANGAGTGAFVQAFNHEGADATDDEPRQIAIPERGNAYGSFEDAAAAAIAEVLSAAKGNRYEWGEYVFSGPDGAYFTSNTVGGVSSNAIDVVVLVPKGFSVVSDLHNHPSGIGDGWKLFSPEDVTQNRSFSAQAGSSYRGSYIVTGEQMRVYRSDMSVTGRPSSLGGPAQGSARGKRCSPSAGFC